MKRIILALLIAALGGAVAAAQDAKIVYVDYPEVEIRRPGGVTILADFGDALRTGDSVMTTRFGEAEIELADGGGTVSVARDTVYQIRVIQSGGAPQTVMSVALGSVRFRFNTIAGRREPVVGAPTAVAGVRGTEFTAYVAADGATVFVVDEGMVDVFAEGGSVQLVGGQGVEVAPGERPGEPFDALARAFDFSTYNDERMGELLRNPERAVMGHTRRLAEFADQIEILIPLYEEYKALLDEANAKLETLEGDPRKAFFEEELVPIRVQTADYFNNMRFYAISALSMRRYILGRMYLLLSLEYINAPEDPTYRGFLSAYDEALAVYERRIVPVLAPSDI
ncbi:MAG: FecR family protein [Spirochaetia bacterium]